MPNVLLWLLITALWAAYVGFVRWAWPDPCARVTHPQEEA